MMVPLIFMFALIGFSIWYLGNGGGGENGNFIARDKNDEALDILKKRFAKGEIDEEEFEERKAILEEDDF